LDITGYRTIAEELAWVVRLVNSLVAKSSLSGEQKTSLLSRQKRLRSAEKKKKNWSDSFFTMDWEESPLLAEEKRLLRLKRAEEKRQSWLEDSRRMDWQELIDCAKEMDGVLTAHSRPEGGDRFKSRL
jgi:hypothetical protein